MCAVRLVVLGKIIDKDFYCRDSAIVAIELLRQKLVRMYKGIRLSRIMVETEAYYGRWNPVSRAHRSLSKAQALYGEVDCALVYGVHRQWLLNVVAHPDGEGVLSLLEQWSRVRA